MSVTQGKTLVTEGKTLMTKGKTVVTKGKNERMIGWVKLPAGPRVERLDRAV